MTGRAPSGRGRRPWRRFAGRNRVKMFLFRPSRLCRTRGVGSASVGRVRRIGVVAARAGCHSTGLREGEMAQVYL